MLYEAFKRRKNTTLLKRFVLRTTEFHQHMPKSTTSYKICEHVELHNQQKSYSPSPTESKEI